MEKTPKHNSDKSNVESLGKLEPRCSYCKCGHSVAWYVEPPPECPYCNAEMASEPSGACLSFPWLSW
jgi:hypothetical protein